MTKPDFSDLHKFIVSLGVILISLALILPWLFLRESFGILVTLDEFKEFTPIAQQLITRRQEAAWWVTNNISYISGLLLLFGICFTAYGSYLWWKRQVILDQKQALEKQKLEHEVKTMTPAEVTHRAVRKLKAVQTEEIQLDYSVTELAVVNYLAIKTRLSQKIEESFQGTHRMLNDQKIEGLEVDIVLIAKNDNYPDGIVEVRFAPQPVRLSWLREAVSDAMSATLSYRNSTPRRVETTVVITAQETILQRSNLDDLISQLKSEIPFDAPNIKVLSTERIGSTETIKWRDFILPNFEPKQAQRISTSSSFFFRVKTLLKWILPYAIGLLILATMIFALISFWSILGTFGVVGNRIRWILIVITIIVGVIIIISQIRLRRNPLPPGTLDIQDNDNRNVVATFSIPRQSQYVIRASQLRRFGLKRMRLRSLPSKWNPDGSFSSYQRERPIKIELVYNNNRHQEFIMENGQSIRIDSSYEIFFNSRQMEYPWRLL